MNLLNTLWDGESKERTETKKLILKIKIIGSPFWILEREREREREKLDFQVKIPIHFQIQNKDNQKTNSWQNPTPN